MSNSGIDADDPFALIRNIEEQRILAAAGGADVPAPGATIQDADAEPPPISVATAVPPAPRPALVSARVSGKPPSTAAQPRGGQTASRHSGIMERKLRKPPAAAILEELPARARGEKGRGRTRPIASTITLPATLGAWVKSLEHTPDASGKYRSASSILSDLIARGLAASASAVAQRRDRLAETRSTFTLWLEKETHQKFLAFRHRSLDDGSHFEHNSEAAEWLLVSVLEELTK